MFQNQNIYITNLSAVMYLPGNMSAGTHAKYSGNCLTYQLVYKLGGANKVIFDYKEYYEDSNTLRFVPKGRVNANYEVLIDEPGDCIDICFDTLTPIDSDCFVIRPENIAKMKSLFLQIEKTWRLKHDNYSYKCLSLVYAILAEISGADTPYLPKNKYKILQPAIAYMEEHYLDPSLDFSALANLCEVSLPYFRKIFHMKYGIPPVQYVTRLKIDYACDLLSSQRYSVTEIAALTGYDNVYYFSRVFKQVTGVTPTTYQKVWPGGHTSNKNPTDF